MDRDSVIIVGAVFAALGHSLPDGAMTHAVEKLNALADEDGTRRGIIMRVIAKSISQGMASVVKAV